MEIKKRPQASTKVLKGSPLKCSVCNSWKKKLNRTDTESTCLTCHYREQDKQKAIRAETNKNMPIAPKLKIGKL